MINTRPLFELRLQVAQGHQLRRESGEGRIIYHVTGGRFDGERLRGVVLPISGDWVTTRADHGKIDVRLLLETSDGVPIYMRYEGINTLGPVHRARLAQGLPLDPASYYFRITPYFETVSPEYDWLNRLVAVGVGERDADGVRYQVHEVL